MMRDISSKIEQGERLSFDDALYLYEEGDLVEIGRLANKVNRKKNNDTVFYNVNRHINPTNICTQSCKFCAYAKKPGEEGAYEYTIEEMIQKAGAVVREGATEVHMVGGLHPRWKFQHYVDMIAAMKQAYPELHIKAFTAVELDWMAKKARKSVKEVLEDLKEAGLGSMPGGGAEIFHPDVRKQICAKSTADRWIEIHKMAHEMGFHSNCTMLYGHVESFAHRVDHMQRLRDLQDETGGFNAFIPLSFQPQDNDMGINRYTLGYDDLKTIAISRLFLDNFDHIKAYWIMLGQDIAQIALNFGANDLDGTVTEEKISRAAGGRSGIVLSKKDIRRLISKAGKIPCERDTLYNPIETINGVDATSDHEMVLYKAEKGVELSDEEKEVLFNRANMFELQSLSGPYEKSFNRYPLFVYADAIDQDDSPKNYAENMIKKGEVLRGETEHNLIFSFELRDVFQDWETPSFEFLIETLEHMRGQIQGVELGLRGIKFLWKICRGLPGGFSEGLSLLKKAGVVHVGSSILENEYDLTEAEYAETAGAILNEGFHATFKAQLSSSLDFAGEIFWDSFNRRLNTIRNLRVNNSYRNSLIIDYDKCCPITPVEYLKALSIAKYLCGRSFVIESQMRGLPVFNAGPKRWLSTENNPAMKYAPLVYHFGAEQMSGIDLENSDNEVLLSEIERSGVRFTEEPKAPANYSSERELILT